jgi:hypothetical protein
MRRWNSQQLKPHQKSKVPDYPTEWVPGKFNDEKADITSFPARREECESVSNW